MGFKAEIFVKTVDENLFCSICHEVFEDPVSCKDGHTFCKACIHEWLEINRKCPLDNSYLSNVYIFPQFTIKGIIDNLKVYCQPRKRDKQSEVRCGWVDKLQHLTHHRKTCPFHEVQCFQCNQTVQRREMSHHEKICDFRKVECDKCGMVLFQHEKEFHLKNDCLQALIFCPNLCQDLDKQLKVEIKRIDLDAHLYVCPRALVDCPCKQQGCLVKVERQDIEKHVQGNVAGHVMLLAKECSLLRDQNMALTVECSSLSSRCSTLAQTNLELNKELKQVKEEFHAQLLSSSSYTWTLHDYPNLLLNHHNGSCIHSPTFWLRGYKWRVLLYPNGKTSSAKAFLSLYLKKVEDGSQASNNTMPNTSSNEPAIPFRFTVISQKPDTDHVSKQDKHVFTKKSNTWGWNKFMKASDAPSYCNDNRLMVQCTIEPDKPQ